MQKKLTNMKLNRYGKIMWHPNSLWEWPRVHEHVMEELTYYTYGELILPGTHPLSPAKMLRLTD
jgi:hypothetical protein